MTTKIVKLAAIREPGYPVGVGPSTEPEHVILNGIAYHVIAEAPLGELAQENDPACLRLVTLRRPAGTKERIAKDYGHGRFCVIA